MLQMTLSTNIREPERGETVLEAAERAFKSGADGYFLGGKVMIDGRKYQVSCNVVRIGSKDEVDATERAAAALALEASKKAQRETLADAQ